MLSFPFSLYCSISLIFGLWTLHFFSLDKECSPLLDIAFIIDSSGSIGRMNWERTKRFVKAVISKLEVSPSAAHVAAISYSTNPRVVLRFNSFQGTLQVNQVFDDMRWERGYTYTDKALLLADSELFQTSYGMRSNVKKVRRPLSSRFLCACHNGWWRPTKELSGTRNFRKDVLCLLFKNVALRVTITSFSKWGKVDQICCIFFHFIALLDFPCTSIDSIIWFQNFFEITFLSFRLPSWSQMVSRRRHRNTPNFQRPREE